MHCGCHPGFNPCFGGTIKSNVEKTAVKLPLILFQSLFWWNYKVKLKGLISSIK